MAYVAKRKQSLEESLTQIRGNEPRVTQENYTADLMRALNWYNANWEDKDYRKSAEQYVKKMGMKDYVHAVTKASFLEIRSIGVIGRLLANEQYIDLAHIERIVVDLENLKHKYVKTKADVVTQSVTAAPVSIQERILDTARSHAAEFDAAIDEYITTRQTNFSAKSYLQTAQVSGTVAKKISEFYKPMISELQEVQEGKDPQLKEAYSFLGRIELRRVIAFVQSLIDDCTQQSVSAKAQRKPRARKAKPAAVVAKKIKCMREYAELKLKSIEPAKIIGSTELWVYVPEKRKLIVYRGAAGGYLGVSGMSVTNYDTKTSEVKTLRKPEEFFKGLSSYGKRAMANAWKAIKAKTSAPRSRISEDMILLAVN